MSKIIRETKKEIMDNKNGEIITTEKEQIIQYPKTPDFIMSFTKDIGYMNELSRGEILTLFGLLKYVTRENQVILNSTIKREIAKLFQIRYETINTHIAKLNKKNIMK